MKVQKRLKNFQAKRHILTIASEFNNPRAEIGPNPSNV